MGVELPWLVESQSEAEVIGSPGFEGFEKRLEIEFLGGEDGSGLRAICRKDLDRMLKAAECTIVAKLSNEELDSYVLSESSLFVYPLKIVIKTCGTTKLLRSIPILLELASELGLSVRCCKYRRGTFFFPAEQAYPHQNFEDEVGFLNKYFGSLGSGGGRGYVLGDRSSNHQWHVYVSSADEVRGSDSSPPTFTLEMCMTNLDRSCASQFYKEVNGTAEEMTEAAGIDALLPQSEICDFAFDPCGYSMNSVEEGAYSTIHVTPEEVCSYASFETMGYGPKEVELKALVDRAVKCFRPGFFTVSVYASGLGEGDEYEVKKRCGSWGSSALCPAGYYCAGSHRQELLGGGKDVVVYHTFEMKNCNEKWGECVVNPVGLFGGGGGGGGGVADLKKEVQGRFPEVFSEVERLKTLRMVQLVGLLACSVQRGAA